MTEPEESQTFCEFMASARDDAHAYAHDTGDPLESRLMGTVATAIDAWLIYHEAEHEDEGAHELPEPEPPVPLNREQRRAAARHRGHVH